MKITYKEAKKKLSGPALAAFNDCLDQLADNCVKHEIWWNPNKGAIEIYLPPSQPGEIGVTKDFYSYWM